MASIERTLLKNKGSHTASTTIQASLLGEVEKPTNDRKTNTIIAGWTISSIIQGSGLLGMPFAMMQCGWMGLAAIIVVASIGAYTASLIQDCMYEPQMPTDSNSFLTKPATDIDHFTLSQADGCHVTVTASNDVDRKDNSNQECLRHSFPDIGEDAFGWWGRTLVEIVQIIEMFGAAVLFIILLGKATQELLWSIPSLGNVEFSTSTICVGLTIIPLMLYARNMYIISVMSAVAGVSCFVAVIVLLVFCGLYERQWVTNEIPVIKFSFPIGFGIIMFSYCGHAVFPSIEQSMRKPSEFVRASNISFILAAIVKVLLGVGMLFMFGDRTEQVILSNLRDDIVPHHMATALMFCNAFLKLPLVMTVVSDVLDDELLPHFTSVGVDSGKHWVWKAITRPLLIILALTIGILVPQFALIMGLIGNITGAFLSFIWPCLFYMKLRWKQISTCSVALHCTVIAFGLVCGGIGTVLSGMALIESFHTDG